jgi:hypothetical protein
MVQMSNTITGSDPNADPHETTGRRLDVAILVLALVPAVFVALRFYVKIFRRKGLWWDDWILLVAWVRRSLQSWTTVHGTWPLVSLAAKGLGHHQLTSTVPPLLRSHRHPRQHQPQRLRSPHLGHPGGKLGVHGPPGLRRVVAHHPLGGVEQDVVCRHATAHHRRVDPEARVVLHRQRQRPHEHQCRAAVDAVHADSAHVEPRRGRDVHSPERRDWPGDCLCRLLGRGGHYPRDDAVEDHLGLEDAAEGEDWSGRCDEHGAFVSDRPALSHHTENASY